MYVNFLHAYNFPGPFRKITTALSGIIFPFKLIVLLLAGIILLSNGTLYGQNEPDLLKSQSVGVSADKTDQDNFFIPKRGILGKTPGKENVSGKVLNKIKPDKEFQVISRRGFLGNPKPSGYIPVKKLDKVSSISKKAATVDVHSGESIQNAIDNATAGDVINIYPGTYDQDEANSLNPLTGGTGSYDYNIFVNKSLTIRGVDNSGNPVTNYANVSAHIIPKRLLTHGNNCAIFVQADNVTISGLEVDAKVGNEDYNFKTIEVVGDNFTLSNCKLNGLDETACLYMDDMHFDASTKTSHVQSYRIENNYFNGGGPDLAGIRISCGAGWSGDVANRVISGNTFDDHGDAIMFVGPQVDPWDLYPVGAATISGNTFSNSDSRHIIAWGRQGDGSAGYGNIDWNYILEHNTFDKAVVVRNYLNEMESWQSTTSSGLVFYNIRGIYTKIQQNALSIVAKDGDEVKIYPGTYNDDEALYCDPLTGEIGSSGGETYNIFINKEVRIYGVDNAGYPIYDNTHLQAHIIPKNLLTHGNNCTIFVQSDRVIIIGLEIDAKSTGGDGNFKAVEVVGNDFTIESCKLNGLNEAACLYFDDPQFISTAPGFSHLQSYTVRDNYFNGGGNLISGIRISSGAGWSGDISDRKILNNRFDNTCDAIAFVGPQADPWDLYPVGAATITGNTFTNSDRRHIIAWGRYNGSVGYGTLNWNSILSSNTFDKTVIVKTSTGQMRTWDVTGGSPEFYNICGIYTSLMRYAIPTVAQNTDDITVSAGTFNEDVNISKSIRVFGAGMDNSIIKGPKTGAAQTVFMGANNAVISGFTITRDGNNTTDWVANKKTSGIACGQLRTGIRIELCKITENRNGIYLNNVQGVIIRDNIITNNRTGIQLVNNVSDLNVEQNEITNNWTVGFVVYYIDPLSGSNPASSNVVIRNNKISGNWYSQVDSKSAPNASTGLYDFSYNWFGAATLNVTTSPAGEPGYDSQIPVAYGGSATAPSGDNNGRISGDKSALIKYSPWLNTSTDTSPSSIGFQGDMTHISVDPEAPGSLAIQDVLNNASSGSTITLYETIDPYSAFTVNKPLTLIGLGAKVNHGSPAITITSSDVTVTGFTFDYATDDYAILVASGLSHIVVHNCNFLVTHGIQNLGMNTVNAENNSWGTIVESEIRLKLDSPTNIDYTPWSGMSLTVSPSNGQTNVLINLPEISWTSLSSGSYDFMLWKGGPSTGSAHGIQIGSTKTLTEHNVTVVSTTDVNAVTASPLDNGTVYYWYIKDTGASTWDEYHFTTIASHDVTLTWPSNGLTVNGPSVPFGWASPTLGNTGVQFVVQYVQSGTTPTPQQWASAQNGSATTGYLQTIDNLLLGKTYFWRIKVQKNTAPYDLVSYSPVYSFSTLGGASVAPVASWPTGGVPLYTSPVVLYWYLPAYSSGLKYQIKLSKSNSTTSDGQLTGPDVISAPEDADITLHGIDGLSLTVSGLLQGTLYYWQVRAYYTATGDWSAWSPLASFVTMTTSSSPVVPTPSYPTNLAPLYTTSPTIYWYLGTYATGLYYDINIATTSGAEDGTPEYSTATADQFSKQLTDLTPGQTYYYKIRSRNTNIQPYPSGSTSEWSAEESFRIVGGVAGSHPVACFPVGTPPLLAYSLRPSLSWYLEGASLGLIGYFVKYTSNPAASGWGNTEWGALNPASNSSIEGKASFALSTTGWTIDCDLDYGTTYYWAVAATDGSQMSDYSTGSFRTISSSSLHGDLVLLFPTDEGIAYSTSVSVSWFINGATSSILSYDVQYSTSETFESGVTTLTGLTNSPANLTGLTAGATYYWKVRANYIGGGQSEYTSPWSFTVQTGSQSIVQPFVGGPTNVKLSTTSPLFSWVLPAKTSAKMSYEIELSDNAKFQDPKTYNSQSTSLQVSGLNPSKDYYWKVRSKSSDGTYSYYSNLGKFSVSKNATAVDESDAKSLIPSDFTLGQNYPNPFNPTTEIRFGLNKEAFTTLKIFNILGQEIRTLLNETKQAGTYTLQWDGKDDSGNTVQSGTYIYRLVSGENVSARKMIMLK